MREEISKLNRTLSSVLGKEVLLAIQGIYFDFLQSSATIYEANGDYALDIYASKYCGLLNEASKKLPRHLCHEDCWATSLEAIKTVKPCERECAGGIVIHAAPIISEGEVIGSNNAGISNPPTNELRIRDIAEKFHLDEETLLKVAKEYEPRSQYLFEAARRQIDNAASLISALFRMQEKLRENDERLRESEQRWAITLRSIGDAIIATDMTGRITFMNHVAETLTGWSLPEASKKRLKEVFRIVNEHTRLEVEDPVAKIIEKGVIIGLANHTILFRRDGTKVAIDDSGAPIKNRDGKIVGVVIVFRDITERRRVEEALHKQADLIDLDPDAIIVKKLDNTITFWSAGAKKLYGWTKAEAMGQKTHELFATRLPQPLDDIASYLKRDGQWSGELVHSTKDGRDVVVRSWWKAKLDERGEIVEILESNVDITEHKQMEKLIVERSEQLSNEHQRLFTVLETLPTMICLLTADHHVAFANRSFREKFGESRGRHCYEYCFGRSEQCEFCEAYYVLKTGQSHHWEVATPDGSVISTYDFPFTDVDGTPMILEMDIDITQQKRLEAKNEEYAKHLEELVEKRTKELKDSERLSAIGATAGMIGHDIRNPLQAINGALFLMRENMDSLPDSAEKKDLKELVESVDDNVQYINKIVADLTDFVRPIQPVIEIVDLKSVLKETLKNVRVPNNIRTTLIIVDDFNVRIDANLMQRVFTNLVLNAVQAMPSGGSLTIQACRDRDGFSVSISDTGVGIPEDVKSKIFTPLFTTKSRGQGFGLVVCKRIVEAHNGEIRYVSEEGKGTVFTVKISAI